MEKADYFKVLRNKFPVNDDDPFLVALEKKCTVLKLEKNELLIRYHADHKKMFFIVSGSFIRSIITSRGEEKTVMFHTEDFLEFVKAYDTVYFHEFHSNAAATGLVLLIMTLCTRQFQSNSICSLIFVRRPKNY